MLYRKIKELYNYGWNVEEITEYCLKLYNKNPYKLWNFHKVSYSYMNRLVKLAILY